MKLFLILSLILTAILSCSKKIDNKFHEHNNHYSFDVEFDRIKERKKILKYKQIAQERIQRLKKEFVQEAKNRGLYLKLDDLNFKIIRFQEKGGTCSFFGKDINLGYNFDESTFYHEVAHCLEELHYSHIYYGDKKKDSLYIMSYDFKEEYLNTKRKEVLDIFFDKNKHPKQNSKEGMAHHYRMILVRDFGVNVKGLSYDELQSLYIQRTEGKNENL